MNSLKMLGPCEFGVFLEGPSEGPEKILLPRRYVPASYQNGDLIEVFLYHDSEDRLVATTLMPKILLNQFALLKVVSTTPVGTFLDWGLPKDLLLPFAEQSRALEPGQEVLAYLYLDKSGRLAASMRVEKHLEKSPGSLKEEQEVSLLIFGRTDLGYKALVEGRHLGVIYKNEVFQDLRYGQQCRGFIKKIRDDGKIDLILQKSGLKTAREAVAPKILRLLEENGGFYPINDKTPAETIYDLFGVSKKQFKVALGGLYKQRLLSITDEGLRLNSNRRFDQF